MGKTDNARLSDWVWQLDITPSEKLILLALLRFRNNHTGLCYPSQSTLSLWTGLSRSGVQKAIRKLRRTNLLEAEDTPGTSNRYSFVPAHSVSTPCSLSKHKPNSNQWAEKLDHPEWNDKLFRQHREDVLSAAGLSPEDVEQ